MKTPIRMILPLCVVALLAACGGGDAPPSDEAPRSDAPGAAAPGEAQTAGAFPPEPTGEVDEELAEEGEEQFQARGCVACHTVGEGRLVGPDLAGITERRTYTWAMSMITNPDSMLRTDSIARRLLSEYFTPMSNQGVTAEQARAIWEYLREEGSASDAGSDEQ